MPIQFNGTTGYLRHNARVVTGFPMSIVFSYANESGQPSGFTTVMQGCEFAEPFLAAAFTTFGDQKQAIHRHVGGTRSAAKLTAPHPNTTTMQWGVVVFTSANSRTVYFGDATGVTDNTAGSDASAGHDITTVGAYLRNSAAATNFAKGHIGEVHFYSTALTASDVTALIGGATPESLSGRVDGWWLDTFQAGGTYTSTSGTRIMTAVGGVSASGLTHPISRSSGYTISLDNGTYSLTGRDITLTYAGTPGSYSLNLDAGSYSVTGSSAFADYSMALLAGTYSFSGSDVTFNTSGPQSYTISLNSGNYILTGRSVNLIWSGGLPPGDYSMYTRLRALGYEGQIDNMFLKFLQDRGATSSNLTIAQVEFLNAIPVDPGQINERWLKYWRGLGHTGSYSDMWRQYWNNVL